MSQPDGKNIAAMLEETKWGKDFTTEEHAAISKYLDVITKQKGETIFLQGDKGDFMAFVIKGSVDITKDISETRDTIVVTIASGTHFGELTLADGKPRSASAVAREDVTLLILTKAQLDKLIDDDHDLGVKILKHLLGLVCGRLRLTTRELVYRV